MYLVNKSYFLFEGYLFLIAIHQHNVLQTTLQIIENYTIQN